jgi:hypothetical protein
MKTRARYGIGKWFLFIFGGTPKPDGHEVYCENCDEVVAVTND